MSKLSPLDYVNVGGSWNNNVMGLPVHFTINTHMSIDVPMSKSDGEVMVVDNSDATESQVQVVDIHSSKGN